MARLIDADALLDFLDVGHLRHPSELCFSEIDVANLLLHAPTISPDEVRDVGKWTRHVLKNANTPWGYDCSACGEWFVISDDTAERYNYCPNCGARMMEVSEDE